VLIRMLGDDDFQVRAETIRILAEIGSESPELAVLHLLPALKSASLDARAGSAAVLVMIERDNPEARRVLIEGISSGRKSVYYSVSVGFLSLGEEGVRIVADGLMDAGSTCGAAAILGAMGEKAVQAVPALMKVVSEKTGQMSLCAIRSLRSIGPGARAAVPVLVEVLDDQRSYIRVAAESALRRIDPSALSGLPTSD
jgi:HEAT repeat protein